MSEQLPSTNPHILVVGSGKKDVSLLRKFLDSEGYDVTTATSLSVFDSELDRVEDVTLALVDADGFPTELWGRCEKLQDAGVPFLVLSLVPESVAETAGPGDTSSIAEKPIEKERLLDFITSIVN